MSPTTEELRARARVLVLDLMQKPEHWMLDVRAWDNPGKFWDGDLDSIEYHRFISTFLPGLIVDPGEDLDDGAVTYDGVDLRIDWKIIDDFSRRFFRVVHVLRSKEEAIAIQKLLDAAHVNQP